MERRSLSDHALLFFVIALFAALVLPALFMDGMFMDGVFYASISQNYAEGAGTFWNMKFSETSFAEMHEQPPLMFFLESFFFKVFSGIYPERVYTAVTAVINTVLVLRAWQLISRSSKLKGIPANTQTSTTWLPLFFFIIMPVTFYAFTHNLEECTMTIFSLLAFNSILRAILDPAEKNLYWILAGMWLLSAGLTKGIQGMFLLSAPFWCWVLLKDSSAKDFFRRTALIALIPMVFVVIAWFTPVIHHSFAEYFNSRFGKTFSDVTANSDNHFHILFELLLDTIPVMLFVGLFILFGRKTAGFREKVSANRRFIAFVFACAFSGILPLMVTREQRGFYLVTALPLIAIACALVIWPAAQRFSDFIRSKRLLAPIITALSVCMMVTVLIITVQQAGKPKREADQIAALHEAAAITGDGIFIYVGPPFEGNWPFISYAQRYHHYSIVGAGDKRAQWLLLQKGSPAPENFSVISLNSPLFDLYQRSPVNP